MQMEIPLMHAKYVSLFIDEAYGFRYLIVLNSTTIASFCGITLQIISLN